MLPIDDAPGPPPGIALGERFSRMGIVLDAYDERQRWDGIFNPACARLADGTLQLYPRMTAPGNVSSIGSFRAEERIDGAIAVTPCGYALAPEAPYELRDAPGGYGCEDPRVTYIAALGRYVMAYVAFGPRGPEVALAISSDGLAWERLGLMRFRQSDEPFADKDASFFPEPVHSPNGILALAFYHRPTKLVRANHLLQSRYNLAIGYVSLEAAQADLRKLCTVLETYDLVVPPANWGRIKVGGGTPPVRIREGWLAVIHGVDAVEKPGGTTGIRYCAGVVLHDADRLDRVIYRSPTPLFVPETSRELDGRISNVVFPTAIDPRPDLGPRVFDIYYGIADEAIGRGRLTLDVS